MPVNETIERIVYEGVDKISAVSRQAADSQKRLAATIDSVKTALASVGVTVGAGALVQVALDTLKATAALDDMAEATGASVEGLSAIQRVAKVGGQDFEGLTSQIGKMVKGLRQGSEEGGRAAQAFAFLDIRTKEADGRFRDTSAILVDLAQKLSRYEDGANKVALVQDALGKGAERYIPLLKDMAEGTHLHATVTARQAAEAERLEKNINLLTVALGDQRRELVTGLTPAMTSLTDKMLEANKAGGLFLATLRGALDVANRLGGVTPLGIIGRGAGAAIDVAAARNAPGTGSQADVRRVENALAPPRALSYQSPDEAATARMQRDREFIARQLEEGAEEERRIQAEAWQWTAFYADKKLELARATEQARIQALIEAYEREQELAIEQGEILAAGPAYTARLEAFRQSLLTEQQLEIEAHQRRLEQLSEFSAAELEQLGGQQAVKEQMEREHQSRMRAISNTGNRQVFQMVDAFREGDLQSATGHLASLTSGLAQHSRKMFELNKAVGISHAIIYAYEGIALSLKTYPWPWNIAAAAAHAALAFAQVQAIRSSTFQGGGAGAAPSLAGSTPATPVTPVESGAPSAAGGGQRTAREFTLIIRGEGAAGRLIAEDLAQQLLELKKDGGFPALFETEVV